jgi:hypothetical protein
MPKFLQPRFDFIYPTFLQPNIFVQNLCQLFCSQKLLNSKFHAPIFSQPRNMLKTCANFFAAKIWKD